MRSSNVVLVTCVAMLGMAGVVQAVTHTVPAQYATIQAAINAATSGDTITVAAGVYQENLSINKALTLQGPNAGIHPVVGTCACRLPGERVAEATIVGSMTLATNAITVDGFTMTSTNKNLLIGSEVACQGVRIANNIMVTTVFQSGYGMVQFAKPPHDLTIEYNAIDFEGAYGIVLKGGDRVHVSHNLITGRGYYPLCIDTYLSTDLVFESNDIDGEVSYNKYGYFGMLDLNLANVQNARIVNNRWNVTWYNAIMASMQGGVIAGNTFQNIMVDSGVVGNVIRIWGGQWNTPISRDVTIEYNTIEYASDPLLSVHGINVHRRDTGDKSGLPGIDGSTIHIHNNNLVNMGCVAPAMAIYNQGDYYYKGIMPSNAVDAEYNWWGTTDMALIQSLTKLSAIPLLGPVDCDPCLSGPVAYAQCAPVIVTEPAPVTTIQGQTAGFSVTSLGSLPLAYQWRKNGVDIPGATAATYELTVAASDDGASFSVVVQNAAGSVTSASATLTVLVPATIATAPVATTVIAGQTASFSVTAAGSAPFAYQWLRNGQAIAGATAATYELVTTMADDGAVFSVTVENAQGSATSEGATLTVTQPVVAVVVFDWDRDSRDGVDIEKKRVKIGVQCASIDLRKTVSLTFEGALPRSHKHDRRCHHHKSHGKDIKVVKLHGVITLQASFDTDDMDLSGDETELLVEGVLSDGTLFAGTIGIEQHKRKGKDRKGDDKDDDKCGKK